MALNKFQIITYCLSYLSVSDSNLLMTCFNRPQRRDRDSSRGTGGIGEGGEDFNRRSRYPDSQQLFVGNLPHNIQEKELKTFFERK